MRAIFRVESERRAGQGHGRRRVAIAFTTAVLLAVPLVSLGSSASARTGRPDSKPRVCANGSYTVLAGDSWSRISSRLRVTMSALLKANGATTGIVIHPGDILCVPSGASSTVVPSTTAPPPTSSPVSTPSGTAPRAAIGAAAIRQFPVQGTCWFTNSWGAARSGGRHHEGVDIIAKIGQYVYAADDGTLTKQYIDAPGRLPGNGWRITRADGTYFFYGHLSTFAPGLKVGSVVTAGQIIGRVGMTGNAGVPHLHFEVHPGGGPAVDPTPIVAAVNGCTTTAVPAQPGAAPTTAAPTTTVVPATTTTAPATTTPAATTTTTTYPTTTPTAQPGSASSPAVPGSSRWQFVPPVTVYDSGGARQAAGRQVTVSLGGAKNVPVDTAAVLVRVAARNVASTGTLTLRACASSTSAPSLSFAPALLDATTAIVPVSGGSFCVVASAAVDVRVAVIAYQSTTGATMRSVTRRVLDTRAGRMIGAYGTRGFSLASLGAPAGATAVSISISVLGATRAGAIGVGECGGTPWIVSFKAQPTLVLSGVIPLKGRGLCITPTVAAHVVIDVTGVWAP